MMLMSLFKGKFFTEIAGSSITVEFTIRNNYEVRAKFKSYGTEYEFIMKKWMKTKEGTVEAVSSFNKFARLMLERFYPEYECFGSLKVVNDIEIPDVNNEQVLNMLKYATRDVFVCAEEIIKRFRRSLLDYCVYHRERGEIDTYEKYIHVVACHCLVHSNFLAPTVHFDTIEYAEEERAFNREWMSWLNKPTASSSSELNDDEEKEEVQ